MATDLTGQSLESILKTLPTEGLKPQTRERFVEVIRVLDQVGRLDPTTEEVYLDEASLRAAFKDNIPRGIEERFVAGLRDLAGAKFVPATDNTMAVLGWQALGRYMGVDKKLPEAMAEVMALDASSTLEDVRKIVQRNSPTLPDQLFELEPLGHLVEGIIKKLATDGTGEGAALLGSDTGWDGFWNCMVRALGWLGAIGVIIFLIGVFVLVFAEGSLLLPAVIMAARAAGAIVTVGLIFNTLDCLRRALGIPDRF